MTQINGMPITQVLDYKNSKFIESFEFYSDILNQWCEIPAGFEMDWESVPIIRGTSKIAGCIHDYLCRSDSKPIVTKKIAAKVYLEFLIFRKTPKIKAYLKFWVVCFALGYFHKRTVL